MLEYKPMTCRRCKKEIIPALAFVDKPRMAKSWKSCYFKCSGCGAGYSNAKNEDDRRMIMRSPEDNVPVQVRTNLARVLEESVNVGHLASKKDSFCSIFSEDAVTWTVFSFLEATNQLGVFAQWSGGDSPQGEPAVSLWGAALSNSTADKHLSEKYLAVSKKIGENPRSRTEPDVIILWQNQLVMIEIKHKSDNPVQADYPHFGRYLDNPKMWSASLQEVEKIGLYELVRNWRLGWELAGSRSFSLINLGPENTRKGADKFKPLLQLDPGHTFSHILWSDFLVKVQNQPEWFKDFLVERQVLCPS